MQILGFLCLFLCALSSSCYAYKALVVFPMPSRSHGILGEGVVKHLLKDGNEVTYITSIEYKNPPPTLHQIDISKETTPVLNASAQLNIKLILDKTININDHSIMKPLILKLMTTTLETQGVKKLLNDKKQNFDVVIVEWMFSELLSGLSAVFNCPLIWVSPMEVNSAVLTLIDARPNPAYNADIISSNIPPFTFRQRIDELLTQLRLVYYNYMYYDSIESDEYMKRIAPFIVMRGRTPPAYDIVKFNASLVVGNSHSGMGDATSLPQSYKHIGGYHIDENVKPLPEDLKKIMEGNEHGVIYFSMGSNLKSKDWPDEIKQSLLKMFGQLKQTVLWKFEEDLPNTPRNVHILKWAPQPSILAHKNCVLFISHGGLLSTTETIHYGVPIIGIPVFGDQFMNVRKAETRGFAVKVDLTYNIAEDLKVAIVEVLSNPAYKNKVKELSFIYHDRPVKPAQELVHWVRHVVKTHGAGHLRTPALDVPVYQRLYLDLIAIVLFVFAVILYLLWSLYKALFVKTKSRNSKKNK